MSTRPRITILGSGFAGLETAFLLRMRLRDHADITVVSPQHEFTFRPNAIYVPFGAAPDDLRIDLAKAFERRHMTHVAGTVTAVDPSAHEVQLDGARTVGYDKLVIATGADMRPGEVPGLEEHAATIWTPQSMLGVRERFERIRDAARDGERSRVLFLIPPNNKCAGPLYEVVLMFETWLRRQGVREHVDITWSTFEQSYIQAFGPRLHEVVTEEFTRRGIEGHLGEQVSVVTEGDFPVKQAFLAFLQADTVAEHLTSLIAGHDFERPFDPVSMCIMEQFDKATFAQVPLALTGDPARPVTVRPDADGDYKVGTGAVWRLGKKMLATTVPMRFHAGEPFHAGLGWQMMDVGLKGMSAVLAD